MGRENVCVWLISLNVFKVRPPWYMSVLHLLLGLSRRTCRSAFIPSSVDGRLRSHLSVIVNNAAVKMCVHVFESLFSLLWFMPESRLAGSCGYCVSLSE